MKSPHANITLYFFFSPLTGKGLIIKRAKEQFYGRITCESSVVLVDLREN